MNLEIGIERQTEPRAAAADRIPAVGLLAAGALLTLLSGPSVGVGALAWLAPVPLLLFARRARGWRQWTALLATLLFASSATMGMLASPPVPVLGVIGFGPPLALFRFGAIALGEAVRRRLGETAGLLGFVAATVVLDWIGYGVTELGAWMATANSQVEWLAFLQLAAIAGLAGLGALMAWVAGTVAMLLGAPRPGARWPSALAPALVLSAGLLWGALRLHQPLPGPSVAVGAVVTEVGPGEAGMPDAATLAANTDALFARTRVAAARGARLVVWNEAATLVEPTGEAALVDRGRAIAAELGIDLVLAYAVLERAEPVLLDNKYVFIADDGALLDTYRKHHPVPGEPSIRGTGPLRVIARPYGRVGGAICYDYDFPAMAREHARGRAEMVVVPSSDWHGIDPVHTLMARVRAVEGGFSVVRSVRWSASAAFDAHGRTRAWMATGDDDGVMVAQVPVGRVPTLAAILGDAPIGLAAALLLSLGLLGLRRRRCRPPRP